MFNLINSILKEARWIGKAQADWLEKVVEHTTPTGQTRKVRVRSLPPEEREKYNPNKGDSQPKSEEQIKDTKTEDLMNKIEIKKKELQPDKQLSLQDNHKQYQDLDKEITTMQASLFGEQGPTPEAMKRLKQQDPDKLKEFNKIKRTRTKSFNNLRESLFREKNSTSMDTAVYSEEMSKLGIPVEIDRSFKGKIDAVGNFRTHMDKRLMALVGSDVKMNEHYDSASDDTYYCISTNSMGHKVNHYTADYFARRKKIKYMKNEDFGKHIDQIRLQVSQDLDSPDKKKQTMALMVSLIDQAYFRIGNAGSEKHNVRGLHNLQVKHLKIEEGNRMHFRYVGKDSIHQHQVVMDDKLAGLVRDLIKDKKPGDYIFSFKQHDKQVMVHPGDINTYMKHDLKAPVTIHKFRTYHATRMAKEALEEVHIHTPPKPSQTKLLDIFKEKMGKIAKLMGHTSLNTTVKHYIDSSVIMNFFDSLHLIPPPAISNLMAVAASLFKRADDTYIPVVSDYAITEKEEKFNDWMDTLPESVMKLEEIKIDGPVDEDDEDFR